MTEDEMQLLGFIVDHDKQHGAFGAYIDDDRMWGLLKLGMIKVSDKINNDIFVKPTGEGRAVIRRMRNNIP